MIFSVIIPCYNCEATISRALLSVATQTFHDFEIILVDDGSEDATCKVIKEFFQDKNHLSYHYIYQQNRGAGTARNIAVQHAQGDFLAFLDADDEWREDKLEIQYAFIQQHQAKFLSTSYTFDSFTQEKDLLVKQYDFKDFLFSNRTSTPCTVVEKKLFNEVGGFLDGQRYSEDYYLWLKISKKESLFFMVKPSLTRLHKRAYGESGLSSKMWEMEKGELANYSFCFQNGLITYAQYLFFIGFSLGKYGLRVIKNYIQQRKYFR